MPEKKITKAQRAIFFKVLSESGLVNAAAFKANIKRRWAEKQRELDADWANDWEDALSVACERLEETLWDRAINGTEKIMIVPGKGIVIGEPKPGEEKGSPFMIREYDGKLLQFALQGNIPDKYGPMAGQVIPALPADMRPQPKPIPDDPDAPEAIEE
jgi:hypothetical protein